MEHVEHICNNYPNMRGIIHTHNYYIAKYIVQHANPKLSRRMTLQIAGEDKRKLLQRHADKTDSILVAPGLYEGVDLRDDLSRFQIVAKIPFPNFFDDKQLAARKEADEAYVIWLTALRLVQCVGRSVRSETDWAHTYIIDESFGWWYKRNKSIVPDWFSESVQTI
jgi:Rad3-related DNA helicase